MSKLKAFVLGILEARTDFTTSYDDDLLSAYDRGRDLARHYFWRLP